MRLLVMLVMAIILIIYSYKNLDEKKLVGDSSLPINTEIFTAKDMSNDKKSSSDLQVNNNPQIHEYNCEQFNQWLERGGEEFITSWAKENLVLSVEYIAPYGQMDEKALLLSAKGGDALAMYALALNYRWHSRFIDFNSPIFSSASFERQGEQSKKFDLLKMDKSIEYFFQAALSGYPTALIEAIESLKIKIYELRKIALDDESTLNALELDILVLNDIFTQIAPELATLYIVQSDHDDKVTNMNEREREQYLKKLEQVKSKWMVGREKLGKDFKIDFDLSLEDIKFGLAPNSDCL